MRAEPGRCLKGLGPALATRRGQQRRLRDVVCSQAYERNVEQERSRRAGVEALEDARQKWRYSNRIQVKERRDMAERYRRTGKLDAQLSVGDRPWPRSPLSSGRASN